MDVVALVQKMSYDQCWGQGFVEIFLLVNRFVPLSGSPSGILVANCNVVSLTIDEMAREHNVTDVVKAREILYSLERIQH